MRKLLITMAAASALAGCATQGLYQWGGYEDALYASYKDASKSEALRLKLQAHIQAMEKSGQKVAPGLYAEVGTLYLQAGQRTTAIGWYERERQAWPESRQLMTAMIQNLQRLESGGSPKSEAPVSMKEVSQ